MAFSSRRFLEAARAAARLADDKMALDVVLLDVGRVSGVADYFVIASVESPPQLNAVADHVKEGLRDAFGLRPLRRDGRDKSPWQVIDFGGLVLHLFQTQARVFYALEHLWEAAKPLAWESAAKESAAPKKTAAKRPFVKRPTAKRPAVKRPRRA